MRKNRHRFGNCVIKIVMGWVGWAGGLAAILYHVYVHDP